MSTQKPPEHEKRQQLVSGMGASALGHEVHSADAIETTASKGSQLISFFQDHTTKVSVGAA